MKKQRTVPRSSEPRVNVLRVYRMLTEALGPRALPELTLVGIDRRWDAIAASQKQPSA